MFVRKTVALTMFTGFKVGRSELFVTYLQYFGDTFFYRKCSDREPLGHQDFSRHFELALGL